MNSCQLWKRVNAAGNLPESTTQMSLYNVYGYIFVTCVSNKLIKISIYLSHAIIYIFDSHRWYTNQYSAIYIFEYDLSISEDRNSLMSSILY